MCVKPIYLKEKGLVVPCGKCAKCIARRISGWSFRLVKEAEVSDLNQFITLTHEPKHWTKTPNGLCTLNKEHTTKFIKKLRVNLVRLQNKTIRKRPRSGKFARREISHKSAMAIKIKYYLVGEYGTNTQHPHYHILLFIKNVIPFCTSNNIPYNIFVSSINDTITKTWGKGFVHFGKVTEASVTYCLKYINKTKPVGRKRIIFDPLRPHITYYGKDDRIPEYSTMSKGLGQNYITPQMIDWHKDALENRMYIPLKEGGKIALPRYYKEKIYTKYQRQKVQKYFKDPDKYREYISLKLELGSLTNPRYLERLKLENKHLTLAEQLTQVEKIRNFTLAKNKRLTEYI